MDSEIVILDESEAAVITVAEDPRNTINYLRRERSLKNPCSMRERRPAGLRAVSLNNSTEYIQKTISFLVKSIVRKPGRVIVNEIKFSLAFEVQVALQDYELVVSKLAAIRAVAASFAVSEGWQVLIHITPI
jgi:predicted RNA-binding protein YlqC (UPF0109 family)